MHTRALLHDTYDMYAWGILECRHRYKSTLSMSHDLRVSSLAALACCNNNLLLLEDSAYIIGERAKRASHILVMQIEIHDIICSYIYIFGTSIASGHAPIVNNTHAHTYFV